MNLERICSTYIHLYSQSPQLSVQTELAQNTVHFLPMQTPTFSKHRDMKGGVSVCPWSSIFEKELTD